MRHFLATFHKDLLILIRDRATLLVLFFMPVLLVLVLSLVQNNVLEALGAEQIRILLVDRDHGFLAARVREGVVQAPSLRLVEELPGQILDEDTALRLVAEGEFQFALVIPEGSSARLAEKARLSARRVLRQRQGEAREEPSMAPLRLFVDPAIQGVFRVAVTASLRQVLFGIEIEEKGKELGRMLDTLLAARDGAFLWGGGRVQPGEVELLGKENSFSIREETASLTAGGRLLPNAVQQNVPAWSLFGMFFIVVPLSGALLRERREGTLVRLRTLPVSPFTIVMGKIASYTVICMAQFSLMLAVGRYLLPVLGPPALDLEGRLTASFLLALCAALAATGFGLLVGAAARSYEQATMFSSISIVVAAALGGVMVPVYAMPKVMQSLSVISPLGWGINGFLEIFVRGGGLAKVYPHALSLLAFFGATAALSRCYSGRRRGAPR